MTALAPPLQVCHCGGAVIESPDQRRQASPYGIAFSQLHAVEVADMNADGTADIVTGKCYSAHNGKDPGAKDPAVLVVFLSERKKGGTVSFRPVEVDEDSGTGRLITLGDGKTDIVAANKKGIFVFVQ